MKKLLRKTPNNLIDTLKGCSVWNSPFLAEFNFCNIAGLCFQSQSEQKKAAALSVLGIWQPLFVYMGVQKIRVV